MNWFQNQNWSLDSASSLIFKAIFKAIRPTVQAGRALSEKLTDRDKLEISMDK